MTETPYTETELGMLFREILGAPVTDSRGREWDAQLDMSGAIAWCSHAATVEVYATPGWDGMAGHLVAVDLGTNDGASFGGVVGDLVMPLRWTAEDYRAAVRTVLDVVA